MRWCGVVVLVACGHGRSSGLPDVPPEGFHPGMPATGCVRFGHEGSRPLPAGAGVQQLAIGDIDGDGKPDVVITNAQREVWTLLGRSDGSFGQQFGVLSRRELAAIAIGDIDGNGKADLVVAPAIPANEPVTVFLGAGNGSYSELGAGNQVVGVNVHALALRDVDGDGVLDVVTLVDFSISTSHGKGDGTFAPPVVSDLGGVGVSFGLADLDHDGTLDAAVALGTKVVTLAGDGHGHFTAARDVSTGLQQAIAVADLDGDGEPDLGIADTTGIQVAFGTGNRMFTPPGYIVYDTGIRSLTAVDLDGDRRLDLVAGRATGVVLVHHTAARTFVAEGHRVGVLPGMLVVGDVDGDGAADLVAAGSAPGGAVILNRGDGTFDLDPQFPIPMVPTWLATGDVDGDGHPDIVVSDGADRIAWVRGLGNGRFADALVHTGDTLRFGTLADLDRDGVLDLIALSTVTQPAVFRGGAAGFGDAIPLALDSQQNAILAADVTGDGIPDLVAYFEFSKTIQILPGLGDATFRLPNPYVAVRPEEETAALGVTSVAIADLDRDGKLDLAIARGSLPVAIARGNGDGTFQPPERTDLVAQRVFIVDLDGDGVADLVTDRPGLAGRGQGDGTFGPPEVTMLDSIVGLRDVDGDQRFDALLGGSGMSIALGNGDGTFLPPGVVAPPMPADLIDVDGDLAPDLVLGDGGQAIDVLLNHSTTASCGQ